MRGKNKRKCRGEKVLHDSGPGDSDVYCPSRCRNLETGFGRVKKVLFLIATKPICYVKRPRQKERRKEETHEDIKGKTRREKGQTGIQKFLTMTWLDVIQYASKGNEV